MPTWAIDMLGVFLGALLGAFFGYLATRWAAREETFARKQALLTTFAEQLRLASGFKKRGAAGSFRHIPLSALPTSSMKSLLSGDTLDARSDADFIKQIVLFEGWIGVQAEVARLASLSPDADDRKYWNELLTDISGGFAACRDETIKQLEAIDDRKRWRLFRKAG